jgi:hypothetical protein
MWCGGQGLRGCVCVVDATGARRGASNDGSATTCGRATDDLISRHHIETPVSRRALLALPQSDAMLAFVLRLIAGSLQYLSALTSSSQCD